MMTFHLYSSLLLISFSYISVKSLALESHSETVETTTDQCKRFFADPEERPKSTLEVFHINGPCSPIAGKSPKNMPSAHEILHHDRLRAESLQARVKHNSKTNKYDTRFNDTKEVTHIPVLHSYTIYSISVSLGTHQQIKTLAFDTASGMTWVHKYNHYLSYSFRSISCASPLCTTRFIPYHTCEKFGDKEDMCYYSAEYKDDAFFEGVFSIDMLNITQTGDVFPNFLFFCTIESNDPVADEMLGLDKSLLSFVSQTRDIYDGIFSYCIPSSPSTIGFLKLGKRHYRNDVKFTPFINSSYQPSFYFINITSIKVADVKLLIGELDLIFPGTIIDSGTTYTYLPKNVYMAMRNEFQKQMGSLGHQTVQSSISKLDTCYGKTIDIANNAPHITFIFQGGVTVDMDAYATLFGLDDHESSIVCLAFKENFNDDDLSVFGNHQQKKYEVVYDVYGEGLGFIPNGCP